MQSKVQRAGAIRFVSLRLVVDEEIREERNSVIARYARRFLDKWVVFPYEYQLIGDRSFIVSTKDGEADIEDYVVQLYAKLNDFLFGNDQVKNEKLLIYAGDETEVASFLTEPEIEAEQRSQAFIKAHEKAKKEKAAVDELEKTAIQKLIYEGVYDLQNQLLVCNAPAVVLKHRPDSFKDMGRYIETLEEDSTAFEIRLFSRLSQWLLKNPGISSRTLIQLPISYRTISSTSRKFEYFGALRQHEPELRNQFKLTVYGGPDRPSSSVLQKFSGEFFHLFKYINWTVASAEFDLELFSSCRFHTVTLDLEAVKSGRNAELKRFLSEIPKLHKLKFHAAVSGINSQQELDLCRNKQLSYVSGPAVLPIWGAPKPISRLDLRALVA